MRRYTPAKAEGIHHTGWTKQKEDMEPSMRQYCPTGSELAVVDGIAMKGNRIIIPCQL